METEGFYMAEKRWRTWETVGLLVVLAAGNLLHFIYDWTGQSPIAAPPCCISVLHGFGKHPWQDCSVPSTNPPGST